MAETQDDFLRAVRTTCPYCGVGCGVLATPEGGVRGDPDHPANYGRLCSKGTALGETLDLPGRLEHPEVDGKRASWDAALDVVAEGFRTALERHGPGGVALYVSGQLLTEDYYAANKLTKGFLGTGNIDSNSRLCMSSAVAAHQRAFREDLVPAVYEDLELADLLVLVGSNLAWCHPVLHQRVLAAKAARPGMRIVVVDPRRTSTCEGAELHLPLAPGSDVALFGGLLAHLAEQGFGSGDPSLQDALAAARAVAPDTARLTGLDPAALATFYAWFASTPRTVTLFSQGVNQSSAGTDKANAILNCHLLTERIGLPGASPFSITGQPNAMGGREVGALATMLAGHLDWSQAAEVAALRAYWDAPNLATGPGLKAMELMHAVAEGRIGALWVMATNPAVSLPDAGAVQAALRRLPMLAVSDRVRETDTMDLARVRLPALGWAEKDGTVTNSERVISRQRPFMPVAGAARPDWWMVAQVAARLGWGRSFAWTGPAAIFREHAAVTGLSRRAGRVFDISGLADLTDAEYDALPPTRWPVARRGEVGGRIVPTARFVATPFRGTAHEVEAAYPVRLLTGRLRDQWHTMTRTGPVPRLMAHAPEPTATANPLDVALPDGDLVAVESAWGRAVLRLKLDPAQARGTVFVPMHWTARFAPAARVNPVVNPDTCPVSGQPELKHTPVRLEAVAMAWHGFVLGRRSLGAELAEWCAVAPTGAAFRHELAGTEPAEAAFARLRGLMEEDGATWVVLEDAAAGLHRAVLLRDGRLLAALFLARDAAALPPRDWLLSLFAVPDAIGSAARRALLAGVPAHGPPPSPTVCVCHGVTAGRILGCGARTVAEVGAATLAGTGCGSCKPEIGALLNAAVLPQAAE